MSGVETRTRLERLEALRSEVDVAIEHERQRLRDCRPDPDAPVVVDEERRRSMSHTAEERGAVSAAVVRAWAREHGIDVAERGAVAADLVDDYLDSRRQP